jgi:hypothetical protein
MYTESAFGEIKKAIEVAEELVTPRVMIGLAGAVTAEEEIGAESRFVDSLWEKTE